MRILKLVGGSAYSMPSLSDKGEIDFVRDEVKAVSDADAVVLMNTGLFEEAQESEIPGVVRKKVEKYERAMDRDLSGDVAGQRILFVRQGGIGDLLFLLPLAQYLKERGAQITIACSLRYVSVLEHQDVVDKVQPLEQVPATKDSFDKVINFKGVIELNRRSEVIPAVDVQFDWVGIDYREVEPHKKFIALKPSSRALSEAQRIWNQWDLRDRIVVGLHLRASSYIRSWEPEHNRKLALALGRRGVKVILLDVINDLAFEGQGILNYAGRLDVAGLIGVVNMVDLVVGPDSGVIQLAGCMDKSLIGIFASFAPELRLSYFKNAVYVKGERQCAPCFAHLDDQCPFKELGRIPPCMSEIGVKQVYTEVRKMIYRIHGVDIAKGV